MPVKARPRRLPTRFAARLLPARPPRGLGLALVACLALGVGGLGAVRGGQYDAFVLAHGEPRHVVARLLGFGIEAVKLSGLAELTTREALAAGGIDGRGSLAFLDPEAVRAGLERHPLVARATVRKLLPSTLEVEVVEREPFALWQSEGEVYLVGPDGKVIDGFRDPRFARLPFVVGAGANERVAEFSALLAARPLLAPHVRAGVRVAGRRWTLRLDHGIDALLPEEGVAAALERLERLVDKDKLLDRAILSVDLRAPDRIAFRLAEDAAAARAEDVAKRLAKLKGTPS